MVSPISLIAHGLPLTPETATGKGWLCLGLAIPLALTALLCKPRASATRLLVGSGFCGLLALCFFTTAETLRRGFGLWAVLGVWIAFAVFGILAELVMTSMFRRGSGSHADQGERQGQAAGRVQGQENQPDPGNEVTGSGRNATHCDVMRPNGKQCDPLRRNGTHFRAQLVSGLCPKPGTRVRQRAIRQFDRFHCATQRLSHFANRRFAWQTANPLRNKVLTGQFATLPTPLSRGK
jgi:hypothetical protein